MWLIREVGRRAWTPTSLVYVVALLLYLLTLSHNSSASHDSIRYINRIDAGTWYFHPHHLLYEPTALVWLKLCRLLGASADSSLIVSSLNSFFGAGIVALVYSLLRRSFGHSVTTALSTTALVGVSFGVWFYSVCVEVYVIALFFSMVALSYLLKRPLSRRGIIGLGLLHGLVVLFHQAYILVGFAMVARIFFTPRDFPLSRIRAFALYLLPAAALSVSAYLAVLIWSVRAESASAALLWFTDYAHGLPHMWSTPSVKSLMKAAIGFTHSFVGGQFVFATSFRDQLTAFLAGKELRDELYLVRNLSSSVAGALSVVSMVMGIICAGLIGASFTSLKQIYRRERDLLLPIIVWLTAFSLFFFIWEPSNLEFWIPQSVLVWLLLDRLWAHWWPRAPTIVKACRFVLPAGLLVTNLFGGVLLLRSQEGDYFYARSRAVASHAGVGDVVITHPQWIIEHYFKRFLKSAVFATDDLFQSGKENPVAVQRFVADIGEALSAGRSVFCTFRPDVDDPSIKVNPKFRGVWHRATSHMVLDEQPLQVGIDKFWVYRRRGS